MKHIIVDKDNPDKGAIKEAAESILRGELVIFPTETVYGLACDATNDLAVERVFDAKGRSEENPLPVQVPSADDLDKVAISVPAFGRALASAHWPGPLTLIVAKNPNIPDSVTCGKQTVGVRVPDHPVALALLQAVGKPIVATSANKSGNAAPCDAQDAIDQIGSKVSIVLDSGKTELGVASTIVDVSQPSPSVLRRGTIGEDDIKIAGEKIEND